MLNKFYWALPAHLMSRDQQHVEYDLTECLNTFKANEFWKRKIAYDSQVGLTPENLAKFSSIKIKLIPHNGVHFRVHNHSHTILTDLLGNIDSDLQYIVERGNLRTAKSLVIVTIEYESDIPLMTNCKKENEFDPERIFSLDEDFQMIYLECQTLANEMASFFLTALHLVHPTRNSGVETGFQQSSGLIVFENDNGRYYSDAHSDIITHPVLIESSNTITLAGTLDILANVWHKELWTIHSYLKALRSDRIEIDNFLDLMFTLESFFPDQASAEFIRTTASILCGDTLKDAQEIDLKLKVAFKIRNEVAHGGIHFRIMDYFAFGSKKYLILLLFWDLKTIVTNLMIHAMKNLLKPENHQQNKLSITTNDLYEKFYSKQTN
ncbi:hypothetical protein [Chitinophaga varians]|uniref:hypothetical protein n=1 Tax=Chitinophaga varians TaxID=2202339 RepID=UPI00165FC59E|nr:hypothetical protein [Chitinophaga varians]MBC9909820.1 hypothetical protein [Chitinophaga varians]